MSPFMAGRIDGCFRAAVVFLLFFAGSGVVAQTDLNPKYFYFVNGSLIGGWGFSVSDPGNWGGVRVENFVGRSKNGKVETRQADYAGKGDAIQIQWSRLKERGQFSIIGNAVNLSAGRDAAAIVFDVRIDKTPNKGVKIGMSCGYPCGAEFDIAGTLRNSPKSKWFSLPIPLNCFKSDNFDLTKINGPLLLSTEGKMKLTLANIRIERLPEGDSGCAE